MTTGSLLWRGMIVGLVAGLLSFCLLKVYGEPAVDRAIAFEIGNGRAKAKAEHDAAVAKGENPPPYEEEPELVSRAGASRNWSLHRRHDLQCCVRRSVRARFRDPLRPDGGFQPEAECGFDRAKRLRRRLRRPDPQISGESAVDRQPRYDRSADRDLFRHDSFVPWLYDSSPGMSAIASSSSTARGTRR